jgi:hypothetical protein
MIQLQRYGADQLSTGRGGEEGRNYRENITFEGVHLFLFSIERWSLETAVRDLFTESHHSTL